MNDKHENQSSLSDPERTRHRLEIFNQLFRGLLLVSGGGIVALFAFLQAVTTNRCLSKVLLVGIVFLALSMVSALLFMKYRYLTSEYDQFNTGDAKQAQKYERISLNSSIAFIGISILVLVVGAWIYI